MSNVINPRLFFRPEDSLAWPFLLFAVAGVLMFSFLTPPFQVPDEDMHFLRAEELSRGQFVSERRYVADSSRLMTGGNVDSNAVLVANRFAKLRDGESNRFSRDALLELTSFEWGGQPTFYENVASYYPPHLYLPGAFAILIGKSFGLGIVDTLQLVRVTNGLLATMLAFVALRLAIAGSALLFFLLLMPMSLFQLTSASQDSLLIGISALTVALLSRLWLDIETPLLPIRGQVLCVAVLIVAASAAKPTHAPLMLLLLAPLKGTQSHVRLRWTCFALGLLVVAGWQLWSIKYLSSPTAVLWRPTLDPARQLADVVAHPIGFLRAVWNAVTWKAHDSPGYIEYWQEFVGVLNWLWSRHWRDAFFPGYFYTLAAGYLLVATMLCAISERSVTNAQRLLIAAAMIGGAILTFLSMYVLFTNFRGYAVQGVQGRYFIPLSMLLGLLVAGTIRPILARDPSRRVFLEPKKWLWQLLLTWPVIALPLSAQTLVLRYYL